MGLMTSMAVSAAAVSAAGGIAKMIQGTKAKKQASRALATYRRQEFKNAHKGRTVSTRGAEMAMEQNARTSAGALDTLAAGGIRGAVGGTGRVQQATNQLGMQIGSDLDQQQKQIDAAIAAEDVRIQAMQEQRENADIQTMQQQLNAAAQTQASGLGDIGQSAFAAASIMGDAGVGKGDTGVDVGNTGGGLTSGNNTNSNAFGWNNDQIGSAFGDIGNVLQAQTAKQYDFNKYRFNS